MKRFIDNIIVIFSFVLIIISHDYSLTTDTIPNLRESNHDKMILKQKIREPKEKSISGFGDNAILKPVTVQAGIVSPITVQPSFFIPKGFVTLTSSSLAEAITYQHIFFIIGILLFVIGLLSYLLLRINKGRKKLIKSEARFRTLLDNTPNATMIFQNYRLKFTNPALEKLTGFSKEELLNMEIWQLIHPQSLRSLKNDEIFYDQNKLNIRTELQILTKNKQTKWIDFSTCTIDYNGKEAVLASAVDITEKKNYQKQVAEAEERYGLIVLATNDGISDYNLTEESLYLSPQWKQMLGFKDYEIENTFEQWVALLHDEDRERFKKIFEELSTGKKSNQKTEYRIICKDKTFKWVAAAFSVVFDGKNKPLRILSTHTDITERKTTEEKLTKSEARYKNFFSRNSAIMVMVNPETGMIKDANISALEYYGYSREEMMEINFNDLSEMTKEEIDAERENAKKENRPYLHLTHHLKNDSIRDVAIYLSNTEEENNNLQYAIIFDITERIKAEKELNKAKEIAEEANKVKSFFVSSISHEIRTPLNAIIGLTDLTIEGDQLTKEQMQNLQSIKYSSDHLLSVINDVLDFSKLEAGKVELEKIDFDLHKLITESAKTIEFKTREKNIDLNVSVLGDTPRVLKGDPSRLRQVLLNLLSNAAKFTEQGHIDINVNVLRSFDNKVRLRFSVSDTGKGIPENKQKLLFQNYSQAETSTSRKFGGTGLGLSICKKIVELQNGEIGLKSLEGMGSTFWFELDYQISEKPFLPENKNLDDRIRNFRNIKILLVEDDKMNQFVMSQLLKKWKATVDIADNGLLALNKMENNDYNLVLMDMHMPELNGVETTRIIRNPETNIRNHDIPIIALTADVTNETRQMVKEAGMNNFITKPSEKQEMFETIMHTLINQKTQFVPALEQPTGYLPEKQIREETKDRVKTALADIFDDDMESTLDLIGRFIKDIPRTIVSVNEAFYDQNLSLLREQVHKIKPGFSYMGFSNVSEKIEKIKKLAREKSRMNELENLIRELEDDSRDITRILREIQREYLKGNYSMDTPPGNR